MVTFKILKRLDAASVLVAVVVALIVTSLLSALSAQIYYDLFNTTVGSMNGYIKPLAFAVIEIVLLEVLCWLYVWCLGMVRAKR